MLASALFFPFKTLYKKTMTRSEFDIRHIHVFICFLTLFDVIGIYKLRILLIVSKPCEL